MLNKVKQFNEGIYGFITMLTIGIVFWQLNLTHIFCLICATYILSILLFCDDITNAVLLPLPIAFLLNSFENTPHYISYGISIAIFLAGLIYFLVKSIHIKKLPVKRGSMFWGFVCLATALFIGGLFSNFNILTSLICASLVLIIYVFYFIFINFLPNIKQSLIKYFIILGIMVSFQFFILAFKTGNFWQAIADKSILQIGVQNINLASIYILLAMISMLYLALQNDRFNYLFSLGAIVFALIIFLTCCRICTVIAFVLLLAGLIYIFIKTKNKKPLGIMGLSLLAILAISFIVMWEKVYGLIERYLSIGVSFNGRDALWPWCFEKFKTSPIFGIGIMYYAEEIPGIATHMVMAHNAFLQFLTSTGVVGSAIVSVYYILKYKTIFKKGNRDLFAIVIIITFAIIAMVDQSPTTDVFLVILTNALVAICERKNSESQKNMQENLQKVK